MPSPAREAYLPVSESFGFVAALRQQTSGQAFPQCVFDHWENLNMGDFNVAGTKLNDLLLAIRKRKNIKQELPALADYLDKLWLRSALASAELDSALAPSREIT